MTVSGCTAVGPSVAEAYALLGVPVKASDSELRSAYRVLVRRYHPDTNGGDRTEEERLWAVQQAYERVGSARTPGSNYARSSTDLATSADVGNAADITRRQLVNAYSAGISSPVFRFVDVRA